MFRFMPDSCLSAACCQSELVGHWKQLAASCAVFLVIAGISYQIPPIMFPALLHEFKTTDFGISWLGAAFQLSKGAFTVPGGYIVDRFGASRCIKMGAIMILVTSICYPFAQTLWQLMAYHAIYGMCYNLAGLAPFVVFTNSWFHRQRACAIGILVSAFSMAGVLFPPVISGVIEERGWRYAAGTCTIVYVVLGLPLLFCVVSDGPHVSRNAASVGERTAVRSAYQSSQESRVARPAVGRTSPELQSNLATPFEMSAGRGVPPELATNQDDSGTSTQDFLHSLRDKAFWHCAFTAFYNVYIIISLMNSLTLFLNKDAGVPLHVCGEYTAIINTASVFGKLLIGALLDSPYQSQAAFGSYLLLFLGAWLSLDWWSGTLQPTSTRLQLLVFSVVYGLGFGASFGVTMARPAKMFGSLPDFGKLQGILMLFQTLGGVCGTLVTGKLRAVTGSYTFSFCMFLVMAAMCLLHCILLNSCSARKGHSKS